MPTIVCRFNLARSGAAAFDVLFVNAGVAVSKPLAQWDEAASIARWRQLRRDVQRSGIAAAPGQSRLDRAQHRFPTSAESALTVGGELLIEAE
jgi:hypothetical protein